MRTPAKIYEAIGRLKERYPRVARYYLIAYDEQKSELSWRQDEQRKQKAESLDGSYLLKSSRNDLSAEDIWRNYILLTRVEAAFRNMKSPLCERPILPTADGRVLTIRRDTRPEKIHTEIYRVLRVPERILLPINRWTQNSH